MLATTERKPQGTKREANPCFALFVGMLLWGMRNANPPAERARPN